MKTQGLWGVVLPLVFLVNTVSGEELSLRPEATSSSLRLDTRPLSSSDPVQVIYDLRPLGGTSQMHPELGLSPVFSERFVVQLRHVLADGLALVSSTGLGLNRTGSVWRFLARAPNEGEQSLLFHDMGLELTPAKGVVLQFSTRLAREMDELGQARSDWSAGAVLALTPAEGTTFNVGAYRSEQLGTRYLSNVFTAGLDSRVGKTPLTISLSGWSALGAEPAGTTGQYSSAGATGLVSWQWSDALWLGAGLQWDASDGWSARYASLRYYFLTVLQVSPQVSFELELSHTLGTYEETISSENSAFGETRLKLSRSQRLLENFSTEISVEMALGNERAPAPLDAPLVRLAAQFSF